MELDSFTGQIDAESLYKATKGLLQCPSCGSLWVFWNDNKDPTEYAPTLAIAKK
jgi:hypothetical protein